MRCHHHLRILAHLFIKVQIDAVGCSLCRPVGSSSTVVQGFSASRTPPGFSAHSARDPPQGESTSRPPHRVGSQGIGGSGSRSASSGGAMTTSTSESSSSSSSSPTTGFVAARGGCSSLGSPSESV